MRIMTSLWGLCIRRGARGTSYIIPTDIHICKMIICISSVPSKMIIYIPRFGELFRGIVRFGIPGYIKGEVCVRRESGRAAYVQCRQTKLTNATQYMSC